MLPAGVDRSRVKDPPVLLVLPGSRHSEIDRLTDAFGEAVSIVRQQYPDIEIVLPTVDHLRAKLEQMTANWPVRPKIVAGEAEKFAAFRKADVALAASGTVTLELALAQLSKAGVSRGNLVVITDGGANKGNSSLSGLLNRAKRSRVRIFTIGVGNNGNGDYDRDLLVKMARSTGGRFASAHSFGALCQALRRAV